MQVSFSFAEQNARPHAGRDFVSFSFAEQNARPHAGRDFVSFG